jgi:glycosyltransferase involved in cell wall biosynthesis
MEFPMKYRMRFTTIGYMEWRKGQDILMAALEGISAKLAEESEFLLVGQDSSLMAQGIRARISEVPWIRMAGTVSRQEIHRILEATDVLICPSREDPMPTVCAEAMLHRVPCLLSDAVGTAAYITDGINGLVFKNEDIHGLQEKILWCMENRSAVKKMGDKAYQIYERVFSVKAFEKRLLGYVEEMTGMAGRQNNG